MKRILIACDKFKGSLSARQACEAIGRGLRGQHFEIELCPMADGGEGMSQIITGTEKGEFFQRNVTGPHGELIEASYGIIDNGTTAVIEMAQASGMDRLPAGWTNDPWNATTAGTGELILDAIKRGASRLLLGIGGSATNDGGTGMAQALGFQFINAFQLPTDLLNVSEIRPPDSPIPLTDVEVACDVTNPVLGDHGCTRIYGPQKGVVESDFERHEDRLIHLIKLVENGHHLANQPGAGAAGALGFGCLAFLNAKLTSGFDLVAQAVKLQEKISKADLIITGEGKIDLQSEQGKVPYGVSTLAKRLNKPTIAFCGVDESNPKQNQFDSIIEIDAQGLPATEAIRSAADLLERTAHESTDLIQKTSRR